MQLSLLPGNSIRNSHVRDGYCNVSTDTTGGMYVEACSTVHNSPCMLLMSDADEPPEGSSHQSFAALHSCLFSCKDLADDS